MADETQPRSGPVGLIVSDDGDWAAMAAAALAEAGWSVRRAESPGAPIDIALLDWSVPRAARCASIARWRRDRRTRGAGLIARVEDESVTEAFAAGCDDRLSPRATPPEIVAVAARWRPRSLSDVTLRLRETFGAAAIDPLLISFARLLAEASEEAAARALAHRVAGVAGTLGFAALGRAWLAFSEGDESGLVSLRIDSRLAIGAILRGDLGSNLD